MKFIADCPFADPEVAARKILEIASGIEPVQMAANPKTRGTARKIAFPR
jgi:hypothetical protein